MTTKRSKSAPSIEDICEIYEGHGKVFENVFSRDTALIEAFLAWGKTAYPRWYEEVAGGAHGAATQAIRLETLIYDEENEAESVAPFFAQLPVEQRDAALATLAAQGGGGDDD